MSENCKCCGNPISREQAAYANGLCGACDCELGSGYKQRIIALEAKNKWFKDALEDCRGLIFTLPTLDVEADINDVSPEDAVAHTGGLILQVIEKALEEDNKKGKP